MKSAPVLLVATTLLLSACHGRPRAAGVVTSTNASHKSTEVADGPAVVELDLSDGAPEESTAGWIETKQQASFFRLVSVLHELPHEDLARAVFVRLGLTQIGFSRAQEIGGLLEQTRQAGKTVVCHAHGYTNATYWIAARGCDRIWVSPAGEVGLVGIGVQLIFGHRLLADKLGIDVDFLQVGKYKGAEEMYTRDGPSPEARASLDGVLTALRGQWLDGVSPRSPSAHAAAEDGPFSPEAARRKGLIDATGDIDDARQDAKKLAGVDTVDVRFGTAAHGSRGPDVGDILHSLAGGSAGFGGTPHVSVMRATGAIGMESGGSLMGGRTGVSERAFGQLIRKLAEDASARAIVLRIDSPGGSALAADLLWKELIQLRAKKPLVVSIGDMAASGGYYLASTATRILAEPTSIVGSIGVVGGKLAFGRALEQVGVHVETIAASASPEARARAAYESPFQAWDAPTRQRVLEQMTAIYELFVRRVAEGRTRSIAQISEVAEGRIFAGQAAQEAGLVDEWGGLDRAIAVARELGKLDDHAPVRLVGAPHGLWDLLDGDGDGDGEAESSDESRRNGSAMMVLELAKVLSAGLGGREFAGLKGHFGSIQPLFLGSEHAITALPFALLLH